jgi:hypothetical protein
MEQKEQVVEAVNEQKIRVEIEIDQDGNISINHNGLNKLILIGVLEVSKTLLTQSNEEQ